MKTGIRKLLLLTALTAGLVLLPAGRAPAQICSNVYTFTALSVPYTGTNRDGAFPESGLLYSSNVLYGTTYYGGTSAKGTLFRVNTDGTAFTNLHSFTAEMTNNLGINTNGDGANSVSGLILSGNVLYGTAQNGGTAGEGTVFRINTDGTAFTNLHNFSAIASPYYTNSDGVRPQDALIVSGNVLYGTAEYGGSNATGTIFRLNTDSTGFTNLFNFTNFIYGQYPIGGLLLSGNTLYGTTSIGSSGDNGTVFKINTDGTGFSNVYVFTATPGPDYPYTNSDGAQPNGTLILSGGVLYGTTTSGGSAGDGTVFAVNTNGNGFTNLHSFSGSDGAGPYGALILSGSTLYGTTYQGGNSGYGTVFAINTNGTGFTSLHSILVSEGAYVSSGLALASNFLYGTAEEGGSLGYGTVFSVFIQPQLAIGSSGTNVIVTWPTNYPGFTLQSVTNPVPTAVWSNVSPGPVVVNGLDTVTNGASGAKKFYRLIN